MNPLRAYVDEHGAERVAEELSALLGRSIKPRGVWLHANRPKPPQAWVDVLGLTTAGPTLTDPQSAAGPSVASPPLSGDGGSRQAERPPEAPPGTKLAAQPLALQATARKRIASVYVAIGAAVATAADSDGFEHDRGVGGGVGAVWTNGSDPVAEAWINLANEGNRFAQSFVNAMTLGGATGELVICHLALLGGTAYVMGAIPDNEATRVPFGKYRRYRIVTPTPPPAPPSESSANGSGETGTADFLGGVAAEAGD